MHKILTKEEYKRRLEEIKPLEILTEQEIKKLKESGEIALFSPRINHQGRDYLLIVYNNLYGAILYEFDKENKSYKIKN
ncbi:MAG: hypothetical protein AABW57_01040 [Nanoarchaeota archaeon]